MNTQSHVYTYIHIYIYTQTLTHSPWIVHGTNVSYMIQAKDKNDVTHLVYDMWTKPSGHEWCVHIYNIHIRICIYMYTHIYTYIYTQALTHSPSKNESFCWIVHGTNVSCIIQAKDKNDVTHLVYDMWMKPSGHEWCYSSPVSLHMMNHLIRPCQIQWWIFTFDFYKVEGVSKKNTSSWKSISIAADAERRIMGEVHSSLVVDGA